MDMLAPPVEAHTLKEYLGSLQHSGEDKNIVYDVWGILNQQSEMVNKPWSDQFGHWTPLLYVCYKWLTHAWMDRSIAGKLVEVLLNQGADPNRTGLVFLDDEWVNDVTPLYLAARAEACVIVEMLLVAGGNARKVTSNGETVLHALCKGTEVTVARTTKINGKIANLFMENGVQVNAQDHKGRTPLHYVVRNYSHSQYESFMMLIKQGASVDVKDKNGRNILELAAEEGHLGIVESLLKSKSWDFEEVAEAYELLGQNFRHRSCYEMLLQATRMRLKGNCPKILSEPLECYGGVLEWQTERELLDMRDASDFLERQCQIARERIFQNRIIGLRQMSDYIIRSMNVGDPRVKLLVLRQIELFHRNGDYTAFGQVFFRNRMDPGVLLQLLLSGDEFGMIPEFLKLAIACCEELSKKARKSTKSDVCAFRNNILVLEKTLLIGLRLVHHLKNKMDVTQFVKKLVKASYNDIPEFDYRATLLLIYLNPLHSSELANNCWLNLELVRMITRFTDCSILDYCNNNCLHLAIISSFGDPKVAPVIKHLVKECVHYDGRNIHGYTAEDIAEKNYTTLYHFLREHRPFPSLKCLTSQVIKNYAIQYGSKLPKLLSDFVAMH